MDLRPSQEDPRRTRDRAALTALGAQEGPRRRAQAPDRGHAGDRAGALTTDDRAVPGNWRGRPDHRQGRGQRDGRPWSSAPPAASSWWAFPRGRKGAAWCGRPHPPHPRTARRRDEHPDLGPGERNGPPPAPGAPPPRAGRVPSPTPTALGKGARTRTPTASCAATCPKAPPSPATNPTSTPSPTNSTTAPAPPSTTPPHKKHSPNSLPPPLDTTEPTQITNKNTTLSTYYHINTQ